MQTCVRIKPLKSCEKNSKNYSLSRSLKHNFRQYDEAHIDKNLSNKNFFYEKLSPEIIEQRLKDMKEKFPLVCKNTTIDAAEFVFTINKNFFDNKTKKENFLYIVKDFLTEEFGTKEAVLGVVGHDDEDGFHVHAYAVPLHKTLFKNRFKTEEKLVINYRGKYAETRQKIIEARKNKTSSETKTGQLQTRWAQHLRLFFPQVTRGTKQSEKKHVTPKEYRKMIENDLPNLEKNITTLQNTIKRAEQHLDREEQLIKIKEEEKAMLEKEIQNKQNELKDIDLKKYQIKYELSEMEKEKQNFYRDIKTEEVVKFFGETSYPASVRDSKGKLRKINNPIDYLCLVKGMSYSGSIKFLSEYFSEERALKTVSKKVENFEEKPKDFLIKEEIIKRQFSALGNPVVRVTAQRVIQDDNGETKKVAINLCKDKDEKEFFKNINNVIQDIPYLNKLNAEGWNIYITPIEEKDGKIAILIDDVKDTEKLKKEIGKPNLILETSHQNFQAIYVIHNKINYNLSKKKIEEERKIYHRVFTALNQSYGDEKISGLRHPFRLASYANKKPNREQIFVKIIEENPQEKCGIVQKIFDDELNFYRKKVEAERIRNEEALEQPRTSQNEKSGPTLGPRQ